MNSANIWPLNPRIGEEKGVRRENVAILQCEGSFVRQLIKS